MRRSRRPSNVSESNNPILEVRLPPEQADEGSSSSATLQVPYGVERDGHHSVDYEDDGPNWDQSEPNFFMSSHIVEAPASTSTSQSFSVGCQTAGTVPAGCSSSPPPTYDKSQFFHNNLHPIQNASCSTSESDNFSRGFAEEPPNVTLSLNGTPQQSTDRLSPPPVPALLGTPVEITITRPQHMWSHNNRVQRPWLAFSGDDSQSATNSSDFQPKLNTPPHDFSGQQIFSAVDFNQIHEIDAYLLAYGSTSNAELGSPGAVSSTSETGSNSTGCSHLPSTCSFARNSCAGSSVGSNACSVNSNNYDYIVQNCPRCRESKEFHKSLCPNYNPERTSTLPATICSTCGGKISLQDSLNLSGGSSQLQQQPQPSSTISDGQLAALPGTAVRLCNCFPKFPSPTGMVVRTGSANVISTMARPMSLEQLDNTSARRSVASLASNFEAFLNSHIGIPNSSLRS